MVVNSTPDTEQDSNGKVPSLSGDIRHLIPKMGLRNYWYPLVQDKRVPKRRAIRISLLGDDLVVFRDKAGEVVALTDICPHRGARLSEGDVHWPGYVSCPYHGWTFDGDGVNVAVLSEGPDAAICGKPGTAATKYPTQTLKGMVFVWVGNEAPAPIEDDVPEEFFDKDALITFGVTYWDCNWEVALENSMDSHVNYLHRNALVVLRGEYMPRGAQGESPVFVGNGFGGEVTASRMMARGDKNIIQDSYPGLGFKWPKSRKRRFWTWALKWNVRGAQANVPSPRTARWCGGHHLPGMFRTEFAYDLYTRMCVAVAENKTRLFYYHCTYPKNRIQRWWQTFLYYTYHRWIIEQNFSMQDNSVMLNQSYSAPEALSVTDSEVVQWRRLVVTRHFGGREAPFRFRNPGNVPADEVPMSMVSLSELFKKLQGGKSNGAASNGAAKSTTASEREDETVPAG